MRKSLIAALAAVALTAPLAAQNNTSAPATPAAPAATAAERPGNSPEDRARAIVIFRTFSIAISSDKVPNDVRFRLGGCLYDNTLRTLSLATGRVFDQNKNLDRNKPEQIYAVAAQLCGVKPQTAQAAPGAAPGAAPAPAQAAAQPAQQGR